VTAERAEGPFRVGALEFRPASGELVGPASTCRVAPQPSSLLTLLAARAGRVVTRDEIREHLWPQGKVEFEQGIAFAVREIRKAIEEAGGDPAVLETIPKRGFRLNPASEPAARRAPAAPQTGSASDAGADPRPSSLSPRRLRGPVVGLALALVVFAAIRLATPDTPVVALFAHVAGPEPAAGSVSRNLSSALTTALTDALAGTAGVVGPTGTADLTGPDDTQGARERLGACLVTSGSVEAFGIDSVLVFTQIVRSSDRVHVWARLDTVAIVDAIERVVPAVTDGVNGALDAC
jgi:DNA-binding winged helix-turn-helix (wHTH) protein